MKTLLALLLFAGVVGYFSYNYIVHRDNPLEAFLQPVEGELPTKDAQGRELTPCTRCLATGQITCTAHRCVEGRVPCPGPCLKLSDSGWQKMEGQDPNKLFMIYRINGGTQGVGQGHVGEVYEVRLGKFYALGPCKVCNARTTVECKVCKGSGKAGCPVCRGEKVVVKPRQTVSPQGAAAQPSTQPPAVRPPSEPAAQRAPKTFKLKNGKTYTGLVVARDDSLTWIRTTDGQKVELKTSEIASER